MGRGSRIFRGGTGVEGSLFGQSRTLLRERQGKTGWGVLYSCFDGGVSGRVPPSRSRDKGFDPDLCHRQRETTRESPVGSALRKGLRPPWNREGLSPTTHNPSNSFSGPCVQSEIECPEVQRRTPGTTVFGRRLSSRFPPESLWPGGGTTDGTPCPEFVGGRGRLGTYLGSRYLHRFRKHFDKDKGRLCCRTLLLKVVAGGDDPLRVTENKQDLNGVNARFPRTLRSHGPKPLVRT